MQNHLKVIYIISIIMIFLFPVVSASLAALPPPPSSPSSPPMQSSSNPYQGVDNSPPTEVFYSGPTSDLPSMENISHGMDTDNEEEHEEEPPPPPPPPPPPSVIMNESWTNSPRSFSISGSGNVAYFEYQIDGGGWTSGSGGLARSNTGISYVRARSVDSYGQVSAPSSAKIARVDMTKPDISFLPNGGIFLNETNITKVTVDDGHSGVNNGSLKYSWSASNSNSPSNWKSFGNGNTIEKHDSLGTFYLWIKATDNVGNSSTDVSNSFYIDNKIVKINIEDVSTNGYNLKPVMGYDKEIGENILKLSDIEIEDGKILLRDDNTGDVAVREDFEAGLKLRISNDDNSFIEVKKHKLLDYVPKYYTKDTQKTEFTEITYDLYKVTPIIGKPSKIIIGFQRAIGVVTPEQTVKFFTWITPKDKDSN